MSELYVILKMPDLPETNKTRALITGGLKAVASSIPYVASFATIWSEYDTFKQEKRVNEFMTTTFKRLNMLEDNSAFLNDTVRKIPDVAETMERCVEASIKEVDENKRKIFSDFYCSFIENPNSSTPEERLNIIFQLEQLTIYDINLLHKFGRSNSPLRGDILTDSVHGAELPLMCGPQEEVDRIRKMDPEDYFIETHSQLMHSVIKLESRGLITRSTRQNGIFQANGDMGSDVNQFRQRSWKISPIGYKLLISIQSKKKG